MSAELGSDKGAIEELERKIKDAKDHGASPDHIRRLEEVLDEMKRKSSSNPVGAAFHAVGSAVGGVVSGLPLPFPGRSGSDTVYDVDAPPLDSPPTPRTSPPPPAAAGSATASSPPPSSSPRLSSRISRPTGTVYDVDAPPIDPSRVGAPPPPPPPIAPSSAEALRKVKESQRELFEAQKGLKPQGFKDKIRAWASLIPRVPKSEKQEKAQERLDKAIDQTKQAQSGFALQSALEKIGADARIDKSNPDDYQLALAKAYLENLFTKDQELTAEQAKKMEEEAKKTSVLDKVKKVVSWSPVAGIKGKKGVVANLGYIWVEGAAITAAGMLVPPLAAPLVAGMGAYQIVRLARGTFGYESLLLKAQDKLLTADPTKPISEEEAKEMEAKESVDKLTKLRSARIKKGMKDVSPAERVIEKYLQLDMVEELRLNLSAQDISADSEPTKVSEAISRSLSGEIMSYYDQKTESAVVKQEKSTAEKVAPFVRWPAAFALAFGTGWVLDQVGGKVKSLFAEPQVQSQMITRPVVSSLSAEFVAGDVKTVIYNHQDQLHAQMAGVNNPNVSSVGGTGQTHMAESVFNIRGLDPQIKGDPEVLQFWERYNGDLKFNNCVNQQYWNSVVQLNLESRTGALDPNRLDFIQHGKQFLDFTDSGYKKFYAMATPICRAAA